MSYPVGVHVFFRRPDGCIFFIRRANTGYKDRHWSIPAGRLNSGESITQAAVRESLEEVNAIVLQDNLGIPLIMHHKDGRGTRIYVYFLCLQWNNDLINAEPDKIAEVGWYNPDAPPLPAVEYVIVAYKALSEGKTYIEYGF